MAHTAALRRRRIENPYNVLPNPFRRGGSKTSDTSYTGKKKEPGDPTLRRRGHATKGGEEERLDHSVCYTIPVGSDVHSWIPYTKRRGGENQKKKNRPECHYRIRNGE